MDMKHLLWTLLFSWMLASACQSQETVETERSDTAEQKTISEKRPSRISEIPIPAGYYRIEASEGSMAAYLRNLELNTDDNTVYLYSGRPKPNQNAQYAVLTMDVGSRDLQQCADAVMRLRAEYLYEQKDYQNIHFNFLSDGKPRYYSNYAKGDYSRKKFRKYMDYIFAYANTASLLNELQPVDDPKSIRPGDVFIQKGRPYGHAVTVTDMAVNEKGDILFLLTQSYMPAQSIHVLRNPVDSDLSPWYKVLPDSKIQTPEWAFYWKDLRRFVEQ